MPKVLLAEDDKMMVSLLKTLLTLEGYEVDTLLDKPGSYLENILKIRPDVFLVDVFLGDTNGMDLVREMRRQPELQNMKIIMASGMAKEDECLDAGANTFLLKPYMPDDLIQAMRA
jgi:DNA-binding response OmpR family regulator